MTVYCLYPGTGGATGMKAALPLLSALRQADKLKLNPHPGAQERVIRGEDGCMTGKGGKCVLCGTGDCLRRPD